MRSILVAAALGLFFTVLGTPVAIRLFGVVGFIDDLLKIRRADRHSLGIGKTAKVLGQAGVAVLFALGLTRLTAASTELSFIHSTGIDLGTVAFVVWVFVILASTSNAVNLTDGLD